MGTISDDFKKMILIISIISMFLMINYLTL